MENRDVREPLPAGTVLRWERERIRCEKNRYILHEAISFGGSSIFYSAEKEGNALPFGIKECFPRELAGRLRREHGILTATDEDSDHILKKARERMLMETEISQKLAVVSGRSIPVLDAPKEMAVETAEGGFAAPQGSFLVLRDMSGVGMFLPQLLKECSLPPEEGHPLRTGGRPSLYTIAQILAETLRAVELVHNAGCLYGDVQPENIFFADTRTEKGELGFGCLLDFGCARVFDDSTDFDNPAGVKKTARIRDRMVFSTPGYTAPEIVWDNDGTLQLTPAADVYSVGRLLLFLLRGRTYVENGRDRMLTESASLARLLPSEGEKLGCTPESLRLIQHILDKSLCLDPAERCQSAAELLEDAEKLLELTRPPKNQLALSFSALAEGEFLGREEQISRLDRALREERKPVILWGFAGMGKTELAIEFARRYTRGQAYFVRFQGSARRTITGPIADAFSGYDRKDIRGREKPEEQICREVLGLLGERSENDLLILDGMDGGFGGFSGLIGEPEFRQLCALPMGLLVTTRSQTEGGIEADALPRPLLHRLMRRFVSDLSDEAADRLIDAVEGHTLTVELMARTLKYSVPKLTPEALLEKMAQNDWNSKAFVSVSTAKDREGRMARIQEHLTALFRMADLSEEERRMMGFALPISDSGLSVKDFVMTPDFDPDVLHQLIRRGWIRRSEADILTVHPLVRQTGWRELHPDMQALYRFVECLFFHLESNYGAPDEEITRGVEYLAGYLDWAGSAPLCTAVTEFMCHLLRIQGHWESALRLSMNLPEWLREYRDSDYYPECMYRALSLSTEFARLLGIPSNPLTEYFAAENRIPKHREMFVPESAWGPDRERIVRLRACEEALDKKEYGETIRLCGLAKRWCRENGQDFTDFEITAAQAYQEMNDDESACRTMLHVCTEMEKWERPTSLYVSSLITTAKLCVWVGYPAEARELLSKAFPTMEQLSPPERRKIIMDRGTDVIKLSEDQGWTEEAELWRRAAFKASQTASS